MNGDDKIDTPEDDTPMIELGDETLKDIHGGITLDNGLKFRAKTGGLIGNDTIVGVSNDTLWAGIRDDTPTTKLKR